MIATATRSASGPAAALAMRPMMPRARPRPSARAATLRRGLAVRAQLAPRAERLGDAPRLGDAAAGREGRIPVEDLGQAAQAVLGEVVSHRVEQPEGGVQ